MYITVSAFEVQTDPIGFNVCFWPATGKSQALAIAQKLSRETDKQIYPNAFWVVDHKGRIIEAFKNGKPCTE